MSGIFGFSTKNSDAGETLLHALDVFNRCYGQEGADTLLYENMGAGCHIEHFASSFAASCPVLRQDDSIAVIDALLYNREELTALLAVDEAISDEELLLQLLRAKGYGALAMVNGDFAGAIYDTTEKTWTLFRDHSGVRPLFFYQDDTLFAFSTDMRGLTALPGVDMRINEEKLYARLAGYNDLSLCETEYQQIHCIRPAAWTVLRETEAGFTATETVYWQWRQQKYRMASDEAYQAELRRLITDAVQRRLAAVPGLVGCELSGGLDSSIIAILIHRLGREGTFYSWSSPLEEVPLLPDRDERRIILDICKQEHIDCHFAKTDFSRTTQDIMEEMAVPYRNTYALTQGCQYVQGQGARVMFTGHGGDEGVSHRCNFYELWLHREYPAFFRNIYRTTQGKKHRLLRTTKRVLRQLCVEQPNLRKPFYKAYSSAARFLSPAFVERIGRDFQPQHHYFAYQPYKYILQGGHRVRLDNMAVQGAQCGVRYVAPFIDYRALDFALSIPRAQFHNGYTNRYIYRAAFDDMMPSSLRDMHYKDTPSMDAYTPHVDMRAHFLRAKKVMLAYLDVDYWKAYLDIPTIEKLDLPTEPTRIQYANAMSMLNDIAWCCCIHNLPIQTKEWSETHA